MCLIVFVFLLPLSVRTALIAIIGFMPTKGEGAIGSLDYTPEERRALAKKYDFPALISAHSPPSKAACTSTQGYVSLSEVQAH